MYILPLSITLLGITGLIWYLIGANLKLEKQVKSLVHDRDCWYYQATKQASIVESLYLIIHKLKNIMNKQERFDTMQQRLFEVTNNIAADYRKLLNEVQAGTVSDESLARAEENIAKLEELGASVPNESAPPAGEDTGGGTIGGEVVNPGGEDQQPE